MSYRSSFSAVETIPSANSFCGFPTLLFPRGPVIFVFLSVHRWYVYLATWPAQLYCSSIAWCNSFVTFVFFLISWFFAFWNFLSVACFSPLLVYKLVICFLLCLWTSTFGSHKSSKAEWTLGPWWSISCSGYIYLPFGIYLFQQHVTLLSSSF